MEISAVQIWIRTAFSLVPMKVLILSDCLIALKNNCRVRDWRGARMPGPFPALPHKNCS